MRHDKPGHTLRFTVLQNHFMRCNARDLKLPEWEARFGAWFDLTINLRKLGTEGLSDLRRILKRGGRQGFIKSRVGVTRRALRRKLRVLEEFADLSAIDRLGDLRR